MSWAVKANNEKSGNFKKSLCAGVFEQSLWGFSLDDLSGQVSLGVSLGVPLESLYGQVSLGESLWASIFRYLHHLPQVHMPPAFEFLIAKRDLGSRA